MSWFSNEPRNPPRKKINCVACGKSFNTPIKSDGTIRIIHCEQCRKRISKGLG